MRKSDYLLSKIKENPKVKAAGVELVKEKDDFKLCLGTSPQVHHVPNREDSPIIGAYAYAELHGGEQVIEYYPKSAIESAWADTKGVLTIGKDREERFEEVARLLPLKKLAWQFTEADIEWF